MIEYSENTIDNTLLHKDIAHINELADSNEIKLDEVIINATGKVLEHLKYKLRKI